MNLNDAIDAYLANRLATGFAVGTVKAQKGHLKMFLADVGNIEVKRIKPQHLDIFWRNHGHWGAGTRNGAATNLRGFFAWCRIRGYMAKDFDPMEGTRKERVPPRSRVLIPQGDFETFLDGIKNPRAQIAAALGLYLFLRVSETSALRWQDFDLDAEDPETGEPKSTAEVYRTKTKTIDTLPVCRELLVRLRRWKLDYGAKVGEKVQPGWYVVPGVSRFGNNSGRPGVKGFCMVRERELLPTTRSNLTFILKQALKNAGYYDIQEGGHTLRRSGATALYNQLTSIGHDRSIRICQAMLGHTSVQTTEIYLRLDLDRKVRNELLAGQSMFPERGTASVINIGGRRKEAVNDGQANARTV